MAEKKILTISEDGRFLVNDNLDGENAKAFQYAIKDYLVDNFDKYKDKILFAVDKHTVESIKEACLIFDFDNVVHIDPIVFRTLYKMSQYIGMIIVMHTTQEIFSAFNDLGLSSHIKVYPKFWELEIPEDMKPIQEGGQAVVYEFRKNYVFKLYKTSRMVGYRVNSDAYIEMRNAREAFKYGIPVPLAFRLCKVGKEFGILYEKIHGKELLHILLDNFDNMENYIKDYVHFVKSNMVEIKDYEKSTFYDQRSIFEDIQHAVWNNEKTKDLFNDEDWKALYDVIYSVPERHYYIHGDNQFSNIMVDDQDGKWYYIDCIFSGYGHPIFDMLSMWAAVGRRQFVPEADVPSELFKRTTVEQCTEFWNVYLREFLQTDDKEELQKCQDFINLICDIITIMNLPLLSTLYPQMEAYMVPVLQKNMAAVHEYNKLLKAGKGYFDTTKIDFDKIIKVD